MNRRQSLEELTPDATVGQIVNAGTDSEDLLASIGLNPEKYMDRTLRSVCQERKWSEVELLEWLRKKDDSQVQDERPRYKEKNDFKFLSSQLVGHFHVKSRGLLEEIDNAFPRVHQVHGNQYLWLKNMKWHFDSFKEAVRLFYKFEEEQFLPLARNVMDQKSSLLHGTVQRIDRCFDIVSRDHNRLTGLMKTIRIKANYFENPSDACTTLRIMNQNFELLFDSIDDQFEFEQQSLIPKIEEHLTLVTG